MRIEDLALPGLMLLWPKRHADERGWFSETWSAPRFADAGLETSFVQDNHSYSAKAGTLRGLHYQAPPRAQAKLVRCTRGAVLDAVVDVRIGSPTFGRSASVELSEDHLSQLYVPAGFLHGFVTLTDHTEVHYKCSEVYAAECEGSVLWSSLGIDWKLSAPPILSAKDAAATPFDNWESPFVWEGGR